MIGQEKVSRLVTALVLMSAAMLSSAILGCWTPARAAGSVEPSDEELARTYAPVFYFHPDEIFRPQTVDVIIDHARIRQSRSIWFDVTVQARIAVEDLRRLGNEGRHFLDIWYGDDGGSAYTNYTAHQAYYRALLSPAAGGPPAAVYAHVVRDKQTGRTSVQYWALYYYNDWFNKHEGDWEMVQVVLSDEGQPEWVVLSQHHGGTRRSWAAANVEEGTHPAVYVAKGSHANYFVGDEVYSQGAEVGRVRLNVFDRTGRAGRVIPYVVVVPDLAEIEGDPDAWPEAEWMLFRGRWGESAFQADFGGPTGPADKGVQWDRPIEWALSQPLDTEVWYQNRLRVEAIGSTSGRARITLAGSSGASLPASEELPGLAILHADPAEAVVASIMAGRREDIDLVAVWPDPSTETTTHYRFRDVTFGDSGRATLTLGAEGEALLEVDGAGEDGADLLLVDSVGERRAATWDAPDLVWVGGALPARAVASGVLIALLGSVVPTLGYVAALYWLDRYEREPVRLLAAAFVWGSIPSFLVAVAADVFWRLPLDLIGTDAFEAARLGLWAPVVQEAVKGSAVVFIAWRYRDEFNGVMDGILYGATAGFGFAMTGNLISSIGRFVQWGVPALGWMSLAEGVTNSLDHAVYGAVFGGGLGLAMQLSTRQSRSVVRIGAFAGAVLVHVGHRALSAALRGFGPATVLVSLLGVAFVAIVAGWSLRRQRRWMREELTSELPSELYQRLVARRGWIGWERDAWRAGGPAGWRRARRLRHLIVELAFAKARATMRPEDRTIGPLVSRLRADVRAALGADAGK